MTQFKVKFTRAQVHVKCGANTLGISELPSWRADAVDCTGTPPVGIGATPREALGDLLLRLASDINEAKQGGSDDWTKHGVPHLKVIDIDGFAEIMEKFWGQLPQ